MSNSSPIPFVDLQAQYAAIEDEVLAAVKEVFQSCQFIQGPFVERFENAFADSHGSPFAMGVSNGTSAIALALEAGGVGIGDEVITVAHTFFATVEPIIALGAKPVFVDINPATYTINCEQVAAALTDRTKAIIPVHIYGNLCEMDSLSEISSKQSAMVIEDAAQAHFATLNGKFAGTFGDFGTFSFYPGKNLGAYGDAGCVFAKQASHAELVRKLRDHGRSEKYLHDVVGYNYRMDAVQGAILSVKLQYMKEWTEKRRACAAHYRSLLDPSRMTLLRETEGSNPCYHLFVIAISNREVVQKALKREGIASGIHYPVPVHLQPALARYGYKKGMLPVTEEKAEQIVSLPIYPELAESQVERISTIVNKTARPVLD